MNTLLFLVKKRLRGKVLLIALLLCVGASSSAWAQIYVAPTTATPAGNDNNTGTLNSPYATLQKAHDMAGVNGASSTIIVKNGYYRQQVNITKSNITFQAETTTGVTIDGTDHLNGTWTLVGNGVYKTTTMNWDLWSPRNALSHPQWNDQDPTHKGFGENQLFQDTTMIETLRWPKATNAVSKDVVKPAAFGGNAIGGFARAEDGIRNESAKNVTIRDDQFTGPDIDRWVGAKIFINLAHGDKDGQGWVGRVVSVSQGFITTTWWREEGGVGDTVWGVGDGTEYYLYDPINLSETTLSSTNSTAALGLGEWYKNGSTLYVKTRDGQAPNTPGTPIRNIFAKRRFFAFAGNGAASGYTIDGFNLFACSVTTSIAAQDNSQAGKSGCNNVQVKNLTVKYVSHQMPYSGLNWQNGQNGWTGIVLNGNDHRIENCVITYSAASAISLHGDRNKAVGNRINQSNYTFSNSGAINTGLYWSYDQEIDNNFISNTSHIGISFRGLRNGDSSPRGTARIHHNTIRDFMRRSGDSGAIDVGVQDSRWVRIDHNYIYNTLGHDLGHNGAQIMGLYVDFGEPNQNSSDFNRQRLIFDHNVVTNVQTALLLNGGWEVEVFNNVFIGNEARQPNGELYENAKWSIGNYNDSRFFGKNINIFNNILSHPPSRDVQYIGDSFRNATITKNITNATMAYVAQNALFVAPKFGQELTNRNFIDFRLRDNAFAKQYAVDKGDPTLYSAALSLDRNAPIIGTRPDLGAIEWGQVPPDTEGPNPPTNFAYQNLDQRSFTVTWSETTDVGGGAVSYYRFSSVPGSPTLPTIRIDNGLALTAAFTGLTPGTDYQLQVVAVDNSDNVSDPVLLTVRTLAKTADVSIPKNTGAAINVTDGAFRDAGYSLQPLQLSKLAPNNTPFTPSNDLGANWTATWDDANLYVHVAVTDDIRVVNSPNWYDDDHVELFLNGNGNRPTGNFGTYDFQLFITPGGELKQFKNWAQVAPPAGVTAQIANVGTTGYNVEFKVPFAALNITSPNQLPFIGIDVNAGDDDGETAKPKIAWNSGKSFESPYNFGLAKLSSSSTQPNSVELEKWSGVPGKLVSQIPVNSTTNKTTTTVTTLQSNATGDQYGVRMRGYIIPSVQGNYTFFISSDDNGAFYLSTDDQPANKGQNPTAHITGENAWTPAKNWAYGAQAATQRSVVRTLLANTPYYFEALMKEEGGGDHLAIGFTTTPTNISSVAVVGSNAVFSIQPYTEAPIPITGVSISYTNPNMTVGGTQTLQAYVFPGNASQAVTWSSSNNNAGTVNQSGLVTAVAPGQFTITATSQADASRSATTATITVTGGGSTTPGTGYYWHSMTAENQNINQVVAPQVNDGTPTNTGGAQVNLPQQDSENLWQAAGLVWSSARSGITRVEFVNGDIITSDPNTNGVFNSNAKVQLQTAVNGPWTDAPGWTVSPAYDYDNFSAASGKTYTFSGSALNDVVGIRVVGRVHAPGNGYSWAVYVKEVRAYNSSNTQIMSVNDQQQLKVNTTAVAASNITVFPNPVTDGWITVGLNAADVNNKVDVSLSDLSGRIVYKSNFISNGISERLNIGAVQPGVYVIRISGSNTKFSSKVVVQ